MFNIVIERVAYTLINQMEVFDCTVDVAWNEYMHDLIKEKFTLEEVLNYIEDMQILDKVEERMKNDNGIRYTFDEIKEYIKNKTD